MLYSRIVFSLSLILGLVFAFIGSATAAPQILALVASNGIATPMICVDGQCRAELSSFCLQQTRATPAPGTPYRAVTPDDLIVVAKLADGTVHRLPAGDRLILTSARGSSSVEATLDAKAFGAANLSVVIRDQVSLIPQPVLGDANPHTDQEIAVTTAGLRKLGSRVVDNGNARITAARETNRVINLLASDGQAAADWDKITAWKPSIRSGQYWANQRVSHCQSMPAGAALGRCLRDWHDFLMRQMNTDYWDAVRAGS